MYKLYPHFCYYKCVEHFYHFSFQILIYIFVALIGRNKYYICFFNPHKFFNTQYLNSRRSWMNILHVLCFDLSWLRSTWKNNYHNLLFVVTRTSLFTNFIRLFTNMQWSMNEGWFSILNDFLLKNYLQITVKWNVNSK